MSDVLLRHHRSSLRARGRRERVRALEADSSHGGRSRPGEPRRERPLQRHGRRPERRPGHLRRRRQAVRAATAANVDGHAVGLLEGMNRSYEAQPVWVKVARDDAVLLLDPKDTARLLEESPDPFASTPTPSATAWSTSSPTRSRSRAAPREEPPRLHRGGPGRAAGVRVEQITREEVRNLVAGNPRARPRASLGAEPPACSSASPAGSSWATPRGDWAHRHARADDVRRKRAPGEPPTSSRRSSGDRRLASSAEEGSLAAAFAAACDELTRPEGQVAHWMFALGDTLTINSLQALVLLASDPDQADRRSPTPRATTSTPAFTRRCDCGRRRRCSRGSRSHRQVGHEEVREGRSS